MSEVPIYLRKANGICTKIFVQLATPLSKFYALAGLALKMELSGFIMYCQGVGLDKEDTSTTLTQL